ncbi:hypothetical protein Q8G35_17830 [Peribacillus simplex]|uniref:Uncharacterized protein n=2 Tax=Peribacillus TaxID=2675229 RepID=A0AA90PHF3_9BACI|nr:MULTISPECIES: hypothetical protein [Peribacillus]MDP1420199.1 hypothetical protein [Peribacillus simplex]MDP1453662.1 hypothetical protein [Peribacillus frigoritolerans]
MEAKESKIPEVQEYGGPHLEKVGDKVCQKNWGTFTLLETRSINESFELAPMVITIKDIRRIQLSSLTDEVKDELKSYMGLSFEEAYSIYYKEDLSMEEIDQQAELSKTDIDEEVTYLEITYSVENKDSKELQFFSMENVTFNGDLTYDVPSKNFIHSGDTLIGTKKVSRSDYQPGETRKGTIGLLVDPEENFDRLDSFSFTTDDIADGESHELLVDGTSFEIPLKIPLKGK